MNQIQVSHEKPLIYQNLNERFGADWDDGLIIAFNGKIHSKETVQPQKVIHEKVHLDRQKEMGNDAWWKLYLENDIFRFEEELLAYRAEVNFIKKNIKNREHKARFIWDIAQAFSSNIYGNIVSHQEALKLLK